MLRPEFPNRGVPLANANARASVVKQLTSNHSATVCGPAPLQTRSGRGDLDPLFEKSWFASTVKGKPSWKVMMPEMLPARHIGESCCFVR